METLAYLAPVAFVFALGAIAQVSGLKKEVERQRQEIKELRNELEQLKK